MKKFLLLLVLAAAGADALAQEWPVSVGVGFSLYDRSGVGCCSEIYMDGGVGNHSIGSKGSHDRDKTFLPTFSLSAGHIFEKSFDGIHLGAFMNVCWNYAGCEYYGGPSLLTEKEHIFHFVPQFRVYYIMNESARLYTGLGAGLRYRRYTETFMDEPIINKQLSFAFQLTPLGVSIGEKWSFIFEIGDGTCWSALMLSTGYNF